MKRGLMYVAIAIVFFGIGFGVQKLLAKDTQQAITEAEAVELVQSIYNGIVSEVTENDRVYELHLENDFGMYAVEINRQNGTITSLTLLHKHEENEQLDEKNESALIGKRQAADIALAKVNGVVDDIDLESMNGTHVYKVEIETETEEATIFVQAYTGEILSITFENDDDDDDDDDDEDDD